MNLYSENIALTYEQTIVEDDVKKSMVEFLETQECDALDRIFNPMDYDY